MSKISLITNNIEFSQWSRIDIFKSINTVTGRVSLQTLDFYKGKPTNWKIYMGDEYELKIDDILISKGFIEKVIPEYGIDGGEAYYSFNLALRDKAAYLDSSYDKTENEWKNETVINIIRRICSAYSIDVAYDNIVSNEINKRIDSFKHNEGDMGIDSIFRICNEFGILPISYGDGKLTITKATTTNKTIDAIDVGKNVKQSMPIHSNIDRYSSYTVKGLGLGNDNKQLADFLQPSGTITDSVITSYKPLVIFSDVATDTGKCQTRAKWERNIRAGNSRKRIYNMSSWYQSNKTLWSMNYLVRVKDYLSDIDQMMLISEVNYIYDSEYGAACQLTIVHKDTYSTADIIIKGEYDR